jgi:hypothetical protein
MYNTPKGEDERERQIEREREREREYVNKKCTVVSLPSKAQ